MRLVDLCLGLLSQMLVDLTADRLTQIVKHRLVVLGQVQLNHRSTLER
jgi:hypothetical protein